MSKKEVSDGELKKRRWHQKIEVRKIETKIRDQQH